MARGRILGSHTYFFRIRLLRNIEDMYSDSYSDSHSYDENLQCEICNKSFSDIKQLLHYIDSNHDN